MNNDIVIDTHILAEILKQYNPAEQDGLYEPTEKLGERQAIAINKLVFSNGYKGVIVASSFAFVELLNQFDKIFENTTVSIERLLAFISQPPEWFIIEPLGIDTIKYFNKLPKRNTKSESIALEDAIHLATALQRGDGSMLLTNDHIIKELPDTILINVITK